MSEKEGKVLKVITFDDQGESIGEWTKQLPPDPFSKQYTAAGLLEPPFSMEQLIFLAEQHPTHSAALEQKAADIIGSSWTWKAKDEESSEESQRDALEAWFQDLVNDPEVDQTNHEVLLSAWSDLETTGQALIELARDPKGKLRYWYHIPAHTCRFHKDGVRIAQIRDEKRRWFKRWVPGDERVVDAITGTVHAKRGRGKGKVEHVGNEILVVKRPSRRSSYYGVPGYVSSLGWITLSTAARDDNVLFFENRREPRWAVILENVEDDPDLEQQLREALQVDLKQPHRNLLLPLSGPAKVSFQQLGDNKGDMSWQALQERADASVLLSHRLPGERIGMVRVGTLGGSVVMDTSRVYKEAVVQPSQAILSARINKLIETESEIDGTKWNWQPQELDVSSRGEDEDRATKVFQGGVVTLNEAREILGEEPLDDTDDRGGKFHFELAEPPEELPKSPRELAQAEGQLASRIQQFLGDEG